MVHSIRLVFFKGAKCTTVLLYDSAVHLAPPFIYTSPLAPTFLHNTLSIFLFRAKRQHDYARKRLIRLRRNGPQ